MKRKQKNYIEIGETFEEKKKIIDDSYLCYKDYKELRECYGRFSIDKYLIYEKYRKMIVENVENVEKYGIRSYNSHFIILHAVVNKGGKKYYLLITPKYNYYEEIDDRYIYFMKGGQYV